MKYSLFFRILTLLAVVAAIYCFGGSISDGFFERKTVADAYVNRIGITVTYIAGIFVFLLLAVFFFALSCKKKNI